jgi:Ca-activated chloride channel family protein
MSKSPVPATPAHMKQAIEMIDNSRGGGGTELLKAINRAMALPKQEGVSRTMVVVTDGYVQAEHEVFEVIQQNLEHTNVFTFGIGSSVNRYLIEGMAKSGQGEPFIVTKAGEAQSAAQKFVQYISSPVLTDIKVDFDGLDVYDIEPPAIPDLFAQRPVIVFGKWRGTPSGTVSISGNNGEGVFRKEIFIENMLDTTRISETLNYLWARSRISRISDYNTNPQKSRKKEDIVSLGLKYNLLTPFTSFVAVDEIIRNPNQNSKDVKQPLALPKNVSNSAVGGGMKRVPEPGILILMAMLLLSMAPSLFRRIRDRR